jgi:CheY-like chemotaxis protein
VRAASDEAGAASVPRQPPQLEGRRVLIVDDSSTNRKILRLQVLRLGMEPEEAPGGAEALELINTRPPFDLVLLDYHMAGMDGVAVARAISELRGRPRPPVIFLPSISRADAVVVGSKSLFHAIIAKPIHFSQLFDAICSVFVEADAAVARGPEKPVIDRAMAEHHPLRLLLAEDHLVNQKVALKLLKQMGYRADVACNGLEALEALGRQTYDAVLMDVQMPEMDGLEAARRIRATMPAESRPRLIAMTANAMEGDRRRCLDAGMDDYLSKPIRVAELQDALSKVRPVSIR